MNNFEIRKQNIDILLNELSFALLINHKLDGKYSNKLKNSIFTFMQEKLLDYEKLDVMKYI